MEVIISGAIANFGGLSNDDLFKFLEDKSTEFPN